MAESNPGFFSLDLRVNRIAGFGDAGLLVGLLSPWLGRLGDFSWFLDLFAHFHWQYLIASVVAVPWFAWRRNRWLLAVSVLSLLLNLALIFGLVRSDQYEDAPHAESFLRAVSINVRTENKEHAKVVDFLLQADADVVFVMEVDFWWEEKLQPLKEKYPHHLFEPRVDNFGVAFFSRIPVLKSEIMTLGAAFVPTVVASLEKGGRHFRLIGVHPVPPSGEENSRFRNDDLLAYAGLAAESTDPVLLVGDLNAAPWSRGMRILTQNGHLRLGNASSAAAPTWMVDTLLRIPIDHALAKRPLVIMNRSIGPEVGSDHRPIIAEVGWDESH